MAGNEVILLNRGCMGEPYVIENVCFVGSDESVDITIEQGRIADVRSSEKSVAKASKTWIIPGLWDCHTHFTQWSYTLGRLDLIDARSADEAMSLLREHLEERRESGTLDPDQYVVGMRFRHSLWADDAQPTLAAIDAVSGDQPVALSSADMHCGWVNSAAARKLGVHVGESGLVGELEWFDAYCKLDKGPGAADELMRLLRNAEQDAAGKGVVGVRDYEMAENIDTWIDRFKQGLNGLRIEAGVYPERLQQAMDNRSNASSLSTMRLSILRLPSSLSHSSGSVQASAPASRSNGLWPPITTSSAPTAWTGPLKCAKDSSGTSDSVPASTAAYVAYSSRRRTAYSESDSPARLLPSTMYGFPVVM